MNSSNGVASKDERRRELLMAPIDDKSSGGLIDGFYTDFDVTEEDRACLERFLLSSEISVRREALIALMFSSGHTGPKFVGYARDALILHLLGIIEDSEAEFTGSSVLGELVNRGDAEAIAIAESLKKNAKWRQIYLREGPP